MERLDPHYRWKILCFFGFHKWRYNWHGFTAVGRTQYICERCGIGIGERLILGKKWHWVNPGE